MTYIIRLPISRAIWYNSRCTLKPRSLGSVTYDVKIQKLPVRAGEHTLYGELPLPKDKSGLLPTVICCSGFGTSFQCCKKTVGMCLAMSGFAAYCFDFYGGCKGSKSGGTVLEMWILIFTGRLPSMTGRFSLSTATRIKW